MRFFYVTLCDMVLSCWSKVEKERAFILRTPHPSMERWPAESMISLRSRETNHHHHQHPSMSTRSNRCRNNIFKRAKMKSLYFSYLHFRAFEIQNRFWLMPVSFDRRISIIIVTAFVICWAPYYFMMITFIFLNPDEKVESSNSIGKKILTIHLIYILLMNGADQYLKAGRRDADGHLLFRDEQFTCKSSHLRCFPSFATESQTQAQNPQLFLRWLNVSSDYCHYVTQTLEFLSAALWHAGTKLTGGIEHVLIVQQRVSLVGDQCSYGSDFTFQFFAS